MSYHIIKIYRFYCKKRFMGDGNVYNLTEMYSELY